MKNNFARVTWIAGILLTGFQSMAQKSNETSAVLEYRKTTEAMSAGDMVLAKKSLDKAKGFIDLAAEHADTKESPKTLFYKGEIYTAYLIVSGSDTEFMKTSAETYLQTGLDSYKKGFTISDKFDSDIESAIYNKKAMFGVAIAQLYDAGKFSEAREAYDLEVKLSEAINEKDSLSTFNAGVCAEKAGETAIAAQRYKTAALMGYKAPEIYSIASSALRKDGKLSEAKEIIELGRKKYPSDRSLLLELVNMNIDAGDTKAAEASLAEAIAADPTNKQLYYVIGTIYIELKQNDKAEAALNKAIELDPNYSDAQYQLGAHLVTVAGQTKAEASNLKLGDPNYDKMLAKGDEYYKRAVTPLEAYIVKNPNDKEVLKILSQIYRSLKNMEKSDEYRKRADAIK
jgi:Tfp pilus assembly protein PilF